MYGIKRRELSSSIQWYTIIHKPRLRPFYMRATFCTFVGLCICPATDIISATVTPIGVKFCMMVYIGPGQVFSHLGEPPRSPQIPNFDRKYL